MPSLELLFSRQMSQVYEMYGQNCFLVNNYLAEEKHGKVIGSLLYKLMLACILPKHI